MSRAAQFWRNSVQEWLPKGGKQQLCWVAVVSCVLLIIVQTHKIVVSRFPSASDAAAVEPENATPPAVAALQEAEDEKSAAGAPVTVAQSTERGEPVSTSGASAELAESPPRDEAASSEQSFASSPAQDTPPEPPAPVDKTATVKQVFAAFGGDLTPAVAVEVHEQVDVGPKKLPLFAIIRREVDRRAGRFQDTDARHRAFVVLFGSEAEALTTSTASNAIDGAAEDSTKPQEMPAAGLASENVAAANVTADGDTTAAQPSAENSSVVESARIASSGNAPALDQLSAPQSDVAGVAQTTDVAELPPAELVLVNPLENGGVVLFLLDGQMFSLSPGESQNWPADRDRQVAFHRGESFGDFRTLLHSGHYAFRVGAQGWELVADEQESPR